MKKFLHSTSLLLLSWCLLLAGTQQARATHIQGGQLTYVNVGNNQYVVTLAIYRDCSGSTLGTTPMSLIVRNGCNGTTQGTYPLNVVPNSVSIGTQYCASQQQNAPCPINASAPANALPNYQTQLYRSATITIQPGQWLLSSETCCRPSTANLVGQGTFRYEATLNNQILVNGQPVTIQNNSPQYSPQDVAIPFVPVNQETTLGFNTSDPDNTRANPNQDSLVYSLTSPLDGCNTPVPYMAYPGAIPYPIPGSNPPCYVFPPTTTPSSYTATLPIAVGFNTTGTCPALTGTTNQFVFNAAAGQFTFTPNRYLNTPSAAGDNKYAVVGRVDDYRRLPGSNRRYLVGSVRRELLVIVINSTNLVPAAPIGTPVTPNAGTTVVQTVDSLDVTIQPCNYSQVLVRFTDPNPTDLLTVTYTGAGTIPVDILQSGDIGTYTLTGNGTTGPVARFLFQPSPAYSGRVLRIPFQIQDDACPVRGLQTRILIVRIASTRRDLATTTTVAGAAGLGNTNIASICLGGSLTLRGAVTRPDSTRGRLQTYNYAWTGNGIVGRSDTAAVVVRPTITTRYRLDVNPTGGFQTGVCADTSSILVRVVDAPVAAITSPFDTTAIRVCAGAQINLLGQATRNDQLQDAYSYRWTGSAGTDVPANTTTQNLSITAPTQVGVYRYQLYINGQTQYGCKDSTSVRVEVLPPPAVTATTATPFICPNTSAALATNVTRGDSFQDQYTYRWEPAPGLATADLNNPNPTVNPTATTTYIVHVLGNSTTNCEGTASVTVTVLPSIQSAFAVDSAGRNGQPTNRPPVVYTFTNNTTTAGVVGGATVSYIWTIQRVRDITGASVGESAEVLPLAANGRDPQPKELDESGYYVVKLVSQVSIGNVQCTSSEVSKTLFVPDPTIPNIITPNNDGKNDVFKISSAGTQSKLEIYNRWGRKIQEFTNYQNNWGAEGQAAGTYYYYLTDRNGAKTKGWIEVVK